MNSTFFKQDPINAFWIKTAFIGFKPKLILILSQDFLENLQNKIKLSLLIITKRKSLCRYSYIHLIVPISVIRLYPIPLQTLHDSTP